MVSSTIRLLMRSGTLIKPQITNRPLLTKPILSNLTKNRLGLINDIPCRWSHAHYRYSMNESRVILLTRLFDKIDTNSIKLDSRFVQDLGLDSLDIVKIQEPEMKPVPACLLTVHRPWSSVDRSIYCNYNFTFFV
jgi:hypothetical protein